MASIAAPSEALSVPLGGSEAAEVKLGFGGGELRVRRAAAGLLVEGTFEGGVVERSAAVGHIELEPPPTAPWSLFRRRPLHWDVGLTGEVPLDLRLDTGGNQSVIDLESLSVRRLVLHTGASDTTVRLPAAGQTEVRVDCGMASVTLHVPARVAARIHGQMGLGSIVVDEARFPVGLGGWASPDFDTSADRVDIHVDGGLGTVRIA